MGKRQRSSQSNRRGSSRRSSRSRNHERATRDDDRHVRQEPPDHPHVFPGKPLLVTTPTQLQQVIEEVRRVGSFAFDTEFIGEDSYHPHICVLQIATADQIALIDPLAEKGDSPLDITPIWHLIADPEIETIVHAGDQDLEPVVRLLEQEPANIIDTQVAAGFTNRPYPLGLRHLVEELFGCSLGKGLTFTNWAKRPLSKRHQRYAADDVRYLPGIWAHLRGELVDNGHLDWALEECRNRTARNRYLFDPVERANRLMGNRSLTRREVALLQELAAFRDDLARTQNLPPRTVLGDDVLVKIARTSADSINALKSIRNMPRPFAEKYGSRLLSIAQDVDDLPDTSLPTLRPSEEAPADRHRVDQLWTLISAYCYGRTIDPGIVTTRREVMQWYLSTQADSQTKKVAADSHHWTGWRRELLEPVLNLISRSNATVAFTWAIDRLKLETAE